MVVHDYITENLAEKYNKIYQEGGFDAIIDVVERELHYGNIIKKTENMVCITTHGWSDDEFIIDVLISLVSWFGYHHYVGMIRGGAYYFYKDKKQTEFEIIPKEETKGENEE